MSAKNLFLCFLRLSLAIAGLLLTPAILLGAQGERNQTDEDLVKKLLNYPYLAPPKYVEILVEIKALRAKDLTQKIIAQINLLLQEIQSCDSDDCVKSKISDFMLSMQKQEMEHHNLILTRQTRKERRKDIKSLKEENFVSGKNFSIDQIAGNTNYFELALINDGFDEKGNVIDMDLLVGEKRARLEPKDSPAPDRDYLHLNITRLPEFLLNNVQSWTADMGSVMNYVRRGEKGTIKKNEAKFRRLVANELGSLFWEIEPVGESFSRVQFAIRKNNQVVARMLVEKETQQIWAATYGELDGRLLPCAGLWYYPERDAPWPQYFAHVEPADPPQFNFYRIMEIRTDTQWDPEIFTFRMQPDWRVTDTINNLYIRGEEVAEKMRMPRVTPLEPVEPRKKSAGFGRFIFLGLLILPVLSLGLLKILSRRPAP